MKQVQDQFDKCVVGDIKVFTEKGEMDISEVSDSNSKAILTHDGKSSVDTVKITMEDGRVIECSKNQLILTQKEWKKAIDINLGDRVSSVTTVGNQKSQNKCDAVAKIEVVKKQEISFKKLV